MRSIKEVGPPPHDRPEQWEEILEFPNYSISDQGRIFNHRTGRLMKISFNNYGHQKISLIAESGRRFTRSVAQLVADAFVDTPNLLCDEIVVLDGDFTNLNAENLVWRPHWFAWRYTHQLKTGQPRHYKNLEVQNMVEGTIYESIIVAGMKEGLLFDDIWRSTYTECAVFPNSSVFQIL